MRRTHTQRSSNTEDNGSVSGEPQAESRKRRRREFVVTGRLVPPGAAPPNPNHPLAHLTQEERREAALEALGNLILKVVEDEIAEKSKPTHPTIDTIRDT